MGQPIVLQLRIFHRNLFSSTLVQVRHAAAQVTSNFYFLVVVNKQVGQGLRNNTSQVSGSGHLFLFFFHPFV